MEDDGVFLSGWARCIITPPHSVPLDGMGNNLGRMPNRVLDDLTASMVAFTDSKRVFLLCAMDVLFIHGEFSRHISDLIAEKTGVPAENIVFTASHTHSGPDMDSPHESMAAYLDWLYPRLVALAEAAIADVKPTRMRSGSKTVEGMNHVRRYLLDNGTYAGVCNTNRTGGKPVAHESDADRQLQVLQLQREGGRDILLVNWMAHPDFTGSFMEGNISADYIGNFRECAEDALQSHFVFLQGAAGNMSTTCWFPKCQRAESREEYGCLMTQELAEVLARGMESVSTGEIRTAGEAYPGRVDHSMDAHLNEALEIIETRFSGDLDGAYALCGKYGISSPYKAAAIRHNCREYGEKETVAIPIRAVSVGDVAFISAPYEMFCGSGMEIKKNSPFRMTMICTNSGGAMGYIPTAAAFPHDCFEVDSCKFVPGTGEELVEAFLEMLNTIR